MDTARFIYHVTDKMREPLDLSLEIIDGLALQKKEVELFTSVHYGKRSIQEKNKQKKKCLVKH